MKAIYCHKGRCALLAGIFLFSLWIRVFIFADSKGRNTVLPSEPDVPVLTLLTDFEDRHFRNWSATSQVLNSWATLSETTWVKLYNSSTNGKGGLMFPNRPGYQRGVSQLDAIFGHFDSHFYAWISPDFIFEMGLVKTLKKVADLIPQNKSIVVFGRNSVSSHPLAGIQYAIVGNARLFPWNSVSCKRHVTLNCVLTTSYSNGISVIDGSKTIKTRGVLKVNAPSFEFTNQGMVEHLSRYESQFSKGGAVIVVRKSTIHERDPWLPSILPELPPKEDPLMILFTTFRSDPNKQMEYSNLIKNWAQLLPHIIPVLFTVDSDPELTKLATLSGWTVMEAPRVNDQKIPFLRPMLTSVINAFNGHFYGYCNGDILFTADIFYTLVKLKHSFHGSTLAVGQRSNFLLHDRSVFSLNKVRHIFEMETELFRTDAQDYFFYSGDLSLWQHLHDVVVGRPGYDNYIVSEFIKSQSISVVDVTGTMPAVHQTGLDGNFAGKDSTGSDYNLEAIGREYAYGRGKTCHAPWRTFYEGNTIIVEKRSGMMWTINQMLGHFGLW